MGKPPALMLDDYDSLIARAVVHIAELDHLLVSLIVMWPEPDHYR